MRKDGKQIDCELHFHGESYGWECQCFHEGVLAYGRYTPTPDSAGPSWLTVLGHARTVCGVWICFGANRPSSTRTGCSS